MSKWKQNAGAVLCTAAAAFIFLLPLLRLIWMGFTDDTGVTLANYAELFAQDRTRQAILNTLIIVGCSTLISTVLGTVSAFLVAYTDIRHKHLTEVLTVMPFVIPSYITTMSWTNVFSARGVINTALTSAFGFRVNMYSIGGILFVLGICNASVVYMNVLPVLRKIPPEQDLASRASGFGVWETVRFIDMREAAPAIASGSLLAFLAAIDNFSVPAFLGIPSGIPVLSTYIYENVIGFGPSAFHRAAALSTMLAAVALAGSGIQIFFTGRGSASESIREHREPRVRLKHRKTVEGIVLAFLIVINIFPLITTILSAFFPKYGARTLDRITLENFTFVFTNRTVHRAILTSIVLMAVTCVICVIVGTLVAFIKVRRNSRVCRWIEYSASLTYAVPGIVLALAMIFNWSVIPGVYGTFKIMIIAYVTRYLILQIKSSTNAARSLDPSLEEAAAISGATAGEKWRKVIIPLTSGTVLGGTFMIAMQSLTELTLSSMLASAGTQTIGLQIFSMQQGGNYQRADALSAVLLLVIASIYGIRLLVNFKRPVHSPDLRKENAGDVRYRTGLNRARTSI